MARKQVVARVVYGAFVVVIAAFVASNIAQVAGVLFGSTPGATRGTQVSPACAAAVDEGSRAIAAALLAASSELEPEAARSRYVSERRTVPLSNVETACGNDAAGLEARAALARLDRATESHAVRTATDLHPVRAAAHSFISRPQ